MPREQVLVVAERLDPTADLVVHALTERKVPVFRFDLAEFPQSLLLSAEHGSVTPGWHGSVRNDRRAVQLKEVRAVYYRRPGLPVLSPHIAPDYRDWAVSQALVGMVQILTSLPVTWMHHPDVYRASAHKPGQLVTATKSGLRVPRSLVTNSLDHVRRWAGRLDAPMVCKPIAAASISVPGSPPSMLPTRPVSLPELDESINLTAHYFQECIPKAFEVRLTAVGSRMFPVAIHADSDKARADWRSDYDALTYEPITMPADVADGVQRFMSYYGLNYGAFDFAVTPDGRWVFFECNPAGQWQFIAKATNLPIAEAHASLLQGAFA
ncbi:ATP-grasp ribosomal peptide maturase [Streptomyces mobaraensis]|uniref:ATP-grasp ribosomal peptide maturase n=1 Tax=Streptomyces mobaraensis TaxID=35621 RepID=UPI0013DF06D0|nr:ATP-grasp ribosomal peptide maturase [Streptomyces mobaraensis]